MYTCRPRTATKIFLISLLNSFHLFDSYLLIHMLREYSIPSTSNLSLSPLFQILPYSLVSTTIALYLMILHLCTHSCKLSIDGGGVLLLSHITSLTFNRLERNLPSTLKTPFPSDLAILTMGLLSSQSSVTEDCLFSVLVAKNHDLFLHSCWPFLQHSLGTSLSNYYAKSTS